MSRYSLGTIASIRLLIITKIIYTYNLLPYIISRHQKLISYYTDIHDVDEDLRTIARCGERWIAGSMTGAAYRSLNDATANALGDVA